MKSPSSPRKQVLVITERFWPEPNFITSDVAHRLGIDADVTVIAPHPSYPHGRFYKGVRYWRVSRTRERGITVWRVPFLPSQSLSLPLRAASYLSFALVASVLAPFLAPRPDVVWVYHGPFTTGLASLWFRIARRSRLVITAADLWPESLLGAGVAHSGPLVRALYAYSRWINSFAHHIICSTEGIARRYRADGIPAERITVIPVWIPDAPRGRARPDTARSEAHDVVYAGNLGPAQQLDTLVRAAAILAADSPAIRVHFYGTGAREGQLRALARELGASNVIFHGRVDAAEAFARSAAAAVQVVSLRRSPEFRATVPSKLSLSFAAAAPLVFGLEGDAAAIAMDSGGGTPFDPSDPASLAGAIRSIIRLPQPDRDALRARLRAYYEANFSPEVLVERYAQVLIGTPGG